jgi:hypothetical protein
VYPRGEDIHRSAILVVAGIDNELIVGGGAKRIAPWLGGIIEGACVDDRSVQKIVGRVMGVFVVVEDVGNAEFSRRYDKAVSRLAPDKLVYAGIDLLRLAAKIDGLTDDAAVGCKDRRIPRLAMKIDDVRVRCRRFSIAEGELETVPTPRRHQDDAANQPLGISVHDQMIVGKQGHARLKGLRLI